HLDLNMPQGRAILRHDREAMHLSLHGEFGAARDPRQGLTEIGGGLRFLEPEFRGGEGRQHPVGVPRFPFPQPVHRSHTRSWTVFPGRTHRAYTAMRSRHVSKKPTIMKPSPEILAVMQMRRQYVCHEYPARASIRPGP